MYYLSHTLKNDDGLVTCPVLSAYICPICGATGPVAHTIKYCPNNKVIWRLSRVITITIASLIRKL